MVVSSRKSGSRKLIDVIELHISYKLTVFRFCQSIDISKWFHMGPDSKTRYHFENLSMMGYGRLK
jgi:hypothetical protein